jgi:Arc-like DNA binding domain
MAQKSTQTARAPTDTVQLKLRFSEALRRRLAREAKQRGCSLNTEIVGRLEQSLKSESLHDAPLSTVMARTLFDGLDEAVLDELVALVLSDRGTVEVMPNALGKKGVAMVLVGGTAELAEALKRSQKK